MSEFFRKKRINAIILIVLLLMLIGMGIPTLFKMRQSKDEWQVEKNLELIVAAGKRYMKQNKVDTVSFTDLKDLYLEDMPSVSGESYDNIILYLNGFVSVEMDNGNIVEYKY